CHLYLAAEKGHRDVVAVLVSHGALVDRRNRREQTALYAAIEKNRFAVVKFLLESKASLNIKDTAGNSPLHFAITYESRVHLVELLLQHGADVNAPDSEGKSPVQRAKYYRNGSAIAELLRRYGAKE